MSLGGTGSGTGTAGAGGGIIEVPPDLAGVADDLRAAATALRGGHGDLAARPDAGRSSDEVATALASLAGAVDGLAGRLDGLAAATGSAQAGLTGTDRAVAGAFRQPLGVQP